MFSALFSDGGSIFDQGATDSDAEPWLSCPSINCQLGDMFGGIRNETLE
jgi:hypothetical protein